ncbi:MAG TPA: hypothetical protein VGB07_12320 [Blastocatellia bacterium]|jgi:hypothetical protein
MANTTRQTGPNGELILTITGLSKTEIDLIKAVCDYETLLLTSNPPASLEHPFDSWKQASTIRLPQDVLCAQLRVVGRRIKELHIKNGSLTNGKYAVCPEGMEECDGGCVPIGSCC